MSLKIYNSGVYILYTFLKKFNKYFRRFSTLFYMLPYMVRGFKRRNKFANDILHEALLFKKINDGGPAQNLQLQKTSKDKLFNF